MKYAIDYFDAMLLVDPTAKGGCHDNSDYSQLYRSDGLPVPPRAQLEAAWEAYVPPKEWRSDEFWNRFTQAEQIALVTAAKGVSAQGVQCELLRMSLVTSPTVRSDSPRLKAGIDMLVGFGILTADRAAVLMDPRA